MIVSDWGVLNFVGSVRTLHSGYRLRFGLLFWIPSFVSPHERLAVVTRKIALANNQDFQENTMLDSYDTILMSGRYGRDILAIVAALLLSTGCSSYEPFAVTREFSWRWNAPQSHNPIFVENYDYEFLWTILVDVIDSHFEIEREMPIRLYGNVLTEGHIATKPKIGASLTEFWHADSVGFGERFDCTLQTLRRRVEVHVVPETGGYTIDVRVFKELENNPQPLRAVAQASNLRFRDDADEFVDNIDVDPSSTDWSIIERDAALENRLLMEIVYRLKNPPEIIRQSKEPIRG